VPVDGVVAAHRVAYGVEAVADHAVEALDSRAGQDVDELFRDVLFGHVSRVPLRLPADPPGSMKSHRGLSRLPNGDRRTVVRVPLDADLGVGEEGRQARRLGA